MVQLNQLQSTCSDITSKEAGHAPLSYKSSDSCMSYTLVACSIQIQYTLNHYSIDSIARSYAIYDYSSDQAVRVVPESSSYDYGFFITSNIRIQRILCAQRQLRILIATLLVHSKESMSFEVQWAKILTRC